MSQGKGLSGYSDRVAWWHQDPDILILGIGAVSILSKPSLVPPVKPSREVAPQPASQAQHSASATLTTSFPKTCQATSTPTHQSDCSPGLIAVAMRESAQLELRQMPRPRWLIPQKA
ncbi:hypothetical protein ACMYSQ_005403 [Aspergillus niger]